MLRRRDGTFQGTASAADPSYQDDLEEFDAGVDDCMQVCQSESSRNGYMRTWRLWVAFNVLNLGLCMRASWRVYDTEPGSQTRRRDERDVMRFAMLLLQNDSETATQPHRAYRCYARYTKSGQAKPSVRLKSHINSLLPYEDSQTCSRRFHVTVSPSQFNTLNAGAKCTDGGLAN